jgi:hypothetical protein
VNGRVDGRTTRLTHGSLSTGLCRQPDTAAAANATNGSRSGDYRWETWLELIATEVLIAVTVAFAQKVHMAMARLLLVAICRTKLTFERGPDPLPPAVVSCSWGSVSLTGSAMALEPRATSSIAASEVPLIRISFP